MANSGGTKFKPELAATVLVEAAYTSDEKAAIKYGVSVQSVYNWRKRINTDASFNLIYSELIGRRIVEIEHKRESDALIRSRDIVSSMSNSDGCTEDVLISFVKDKIDSISSLLGLPRVIECKSEVTLPNRVRCDVVSWHEDNSISIYEVKCSSDNKGRGWLLYTAIGQLLYYFETVKDCWNVDDRKINLFVVSNYDADDYFHRALKHVSQKITFVNLRPLIGV